MNVSKLLKILFYSLILLVLYYYSAKNVYSQENFQINVNSEYKVSESGITSVTNTFNLVNKTSKYQADKYVFALKSTDPINVKSYENGNLLEVNKEKKDDHTILTVNFPDKVAGIGKTRTFLLTYDVESIANKSGEIWEISIPKLEYSEDFSTYNVLVIIPMSLGDEAYINPSPESFDEDENNRKYFFVKDQLIDRGVSAGFGKSQVFNFNLTYHLENKGNTNEDYQIAIPPDTSLQRMFYENIDPNPLGVEIDEDGNWLALYTLKPKERIDITAYGAVQIFASPKKISTPSKKSLSENLKESPFWQTTDPQIKELAKSLKTPRVIYDFLISYLTYDNSRVTPEVTRLGAKSALSRPANAICMEFTDLFIALARAAGIPAREINGYAHTDNSQIKPLSLVADVLHSWPEYWDDISQTWVAIDPTWGETSGGDYFTKLDLRHFTFVIHGKNDSFPYPPGSYKLGNNPQKDVFVTFGNLPVERYSDLTISHKMSWGLNRKGLEIKIKNNGIYAQYDLLGSIYFDGDWKKSVSIPALPPFGEYVTTVDVPYGVLAVNAPNKINFKVVGLNEFISTDKTSVIVSQLLLITLFFITITIISLRLLNKPVNTK